ncbi:MAG: CapA family protein [Blautia sp.]|nr:CapA family protein [Blautia sp.]
MKGYNGHALACLAAVLFLGGCGLESVPPEQAQGTEAAAGTESPAETEAVIGTESLAAAGTGLEAGTETEAESEEIPEPVVQTVTVTAVGDCTLGVTQTHGYAGSFHEYYDANGENYFFDGVRDIFEADDFTLVNLECVLTESNDRVEKTWNLKGKPEYVGIMTGSSVEACSLGNNHTYDYGQQSLDDTRSVLDDAGIIYGLNEHVAAYTTDSGLVVGIVSSNLLWQDETHANYMKDSIEMLRTQGADLVIASCHWGIEGDHYANDYQRSMAHQIIDWGADLVVGTHPHVLQGIELYGGKVICYSLGNFCFGGNRNPAVKDTAIYQQTFTFVDGVLQPDVNAEMIPCSISSTTSRNDFQPTVVEGERWAAIIEDMNDYSEAYSNICLDTNGKLMLKPENE